MRKFRQIEILFKMMNFKSLQGQILYFINISPLVGLQRPLSPDAKNSLCMLASYGRSAQDHQTDYVFKSSTEYMPV